MIFEVPVRKIEKLKAAIRAVLNRQSVPATLLVRIAGYLISLNIALGPIARFFTRHMYFVVAFRRSWRDYVYDSGHLPQELKFGLQRVDAFNGYHITLEDNFALQLLFIVTLAIQGLAVFPLSEVIAFVSVTGISLRLLKVLLARSLRLCCMFYNRKVKWFSDSQNNCRIVSVGISRPELQAIAVEIFEVCMSFDIAMEIEWLPRRQNDRADYLRRIVDLDNWSLSAALFQLVDSSWGPHTVDRFASFYNAQVPPFNSRFWDLESEAVDAFTQDWSRNNDWLCPPVSFIIVRAVRHLIACKRLGSLIIPEWPSSYFWWWCCKVFCKGVFCSSSRTRRCIFKEPCQFQGSGFKARLHVAG